MTSTTDQSNSFISSTAFDRINGIGRSETTIAWSHVFVETRSKVTLLDRLKRKTSKPAHVILSDLSGIVKAGELLAVMGTSGVGKTTLLNFLSGQDDPRATVGKGDVFFNKVLTDRKQRQNGTVIGHVQQHEPFLELMTLEEHLIFQAMLRMHKSIRDDDRRSSVNNMVTLFSLERCRHNLIGRLSGGEKKRLGFATVLLSDPQVILIDEPTSGLDLYLAKMVMRMIRSMAAEQHRTVIIVLHQPTSEMFGHIDTLCLLAHGGRQAYFGPREAAVDFFTKQCGLSGISLEDYIEQLAASVGSEENVSNKGSLVADCYLDSNQAVNLQIQISNLIAGPLDESRSNDSEEWSSGIGRQIKWLLWRILINFRRNPKRTTQLAIRLFFMALLYGILLFRISVYNEAYRKDTDALLFLMVSALLESNMSMLIITLINERTVITRDYKRRMYSIPAYYITRIITDAIIGIITSIIYGTIIMALVGFNRPVLIVVFMALDLMAALGMAALLAACVSSTKMALILLQPLYLTIAQFSGYYINSNSIPIYIQWLQYLSFFYYYFHGTLVAQWYKVPCGAYSSTSMPIHANTTDQIPVCKYTGTDVLRYYGADPSDLGLYALALILIAVVLQTLAFTIVVIRLKRTV